MQQSSIQSTHCRAIGCLCSWPIHSGIHAEQESSIAGGGGAATNWSSGRGCMHPASHCRSRRKSKKKPERISVCSLFGGQTTRAFLLGLMEAQQVFAGSIPPQLTERGVEKQLAAYDIYPKRIRLAGRGEGRDSFAILTFASPQLAVQCVNTSLIWSSGTRATLRPANKKVWTKRAAEEEEQQKGQPPQQAPQPQQPKRAKNTAQEAGSAIGVQGPKEQPGLAIGAQKEQPGLAIGVQWPKEQPGLAVGAQKEQPWRQSWGSQQESQQHDELKELREHEKQAENAKKPCILPPWRRQPHQPPGPPPSHLLAGVKKEPLSPCTPPEQEEMDGEPVQEDDYLEL